MKTKISKDFSEQKPTAIPYIFRKEIGGKSENVFKTKLTGHGFITNLFINFNVGEEGTLRVRPYIILPNKIQIDLVEFVGEKFFSGDMEKIELPVYQEIENETELCVFAENIGDIPSQLVCDIVVMYLNEKDSDKYNIIGPWGV